MIRTAVAADVVTFAAAAAAVAVAALAGDDGLHVKPWWPVKCWW